MRGREQFSFVIEPAAQEKEVKTKYDRMIDNVVKLLSRSFSTEDLKILGSALDSNLSLNIEKIDLIIDYLNRIKRAMLQAESTRDVLIDKQKQAA